MKWVMLILVIGLLLASTVAVGTGRLPALLDLLPFDLPGREAPPDFGGAAKKPPTGEPEAPSGPSFTETVRKKAEEFLGDVPAEQGLARVIKRIQQIVPPLKDKRISFIGLSYNLGTWLMVLLGFLVFIRYGLPRFISLGRSGFNKSLEATGRYGSPWPEITLERASYGVGALSAISSALLAAFGNSTINTGTGFLGSIGKILELTKHSGPAFSFIVAAFTALYIFGFMRPIFLDKIREIADLMNRSPRETGGSFAEAIAIFTAIALIAVIALVAPPVAEIDPKILSEAITPSGESVKAALGQPTIGVKATNSISAFSTDTIPNFIRLATGNFDPNLVRLWAGVTIIILTFVLGGGMPLQRRSGPSRGIPQQSGFPFPGWAGGQGIPNDAEVVLRRQREGR